MSDLESDCSTLTDLSSELSSAPPSPKLPLVFMPSYPTPDSSQAHSTYSSSSDQDSRKRRRDHDERPPVKKRKIAEVRERTTEYLDLRRCANESSMEQSRELEILLKVLRKRRKIVVIAGAGISTSAGVPDFRSSKGLFNTLRSDSKLKASGKQLFDASVYQTDASTSSFHDMVRSLSKVVNGAKATAFHHMLATLADEGRLLRLYTQNVDGIDTDLDPLRTEIPLPKKGPWPRTVQLHGSLKKMVCVKCGDLNSFDPELFDGPNPPSCGSCMDLDKVRTEEAGKRSHGIGKLRPRMVLYNEHNPDAEAIGSVTTADLRTRPDAIIVVGTSMEIPGVQRMVREMCGVIKARKDGKCIWVNRAPPPTGPKYEDCWDLVVTGDCDQVAQLADMRKWFEDPKEGIRVSDSDAERVRNKDNGLKVIVQSPKKRATPSPGLPTPATSPQPETLKKPIVKLVLKPPSEKKAEGPKMSKKASKPTTNTSKPKPTAAKAPKPLKVAKINTAFKVTKAGVSQSKKKKAGDESKPFHPIPPKSARSNSHSSPPLDAVAQYKVERIEVKLEQTPGRLKRMSEERISPTGAVPKAYALENILN